MTAASGQSLPTPYSQPIVDNNRVYIQRRESSTSSASTLSSSSSSSASQGVNTLVTGQAGEASALVAQLPGLGDDQPLIDVGGGIHGKGGRSHDFTNSLDAEIQHTGEIIPHSNPDNHSGGGTQKYGRIAAEDDVSIARSSTVREVDRDPQESRTSSSAPSTPNRQKLQRRTEVGRDIAAARAAARGTQHESRPRPAAPAATHLLTAAERGTTTAQAVTALKATPAATPTAAAAAASTVAAAAMPRTADAEVIAPTKKKGGIATTAVAKAEAVGTAGTDTGTSPQGEDRYHETSQVKKKKKKKRGGKTPSYSKRTPGDQRNQKEASETEG